MKNILIPTDFSKNSEFAVEFGAELAHTLNASVTLLHAYNIPVLVDEVVIESTTIENWDKENKEMLRNIARKLKNNHPDLEIHAKSVLGLAEDIILNESNAEGTSLTVMGSKGEGNAGDAIFGNVTSDIIRRAKKPVLIVRPGVAYKPLNKIVLACHKESMISANVAHVINTIASAFHSRLYILDIVREDAEPIADAYSEANKIKSHFEMLEPTVHVMKDEKIVHGINEFAHEYEADLVIMLPGKHNLFERMFTEIHTPHMVKDSQKPLLIIPQG